MSTEIEKLKTTAPSLTAINPLISTDGEWDEDTASTVRGALEFIADALGSINQSGGLTDETAYGASKLIMCCVAAMEVTKA